jgi:hypothetical protein
MKFMKRVQLAARILSGKPTPTELEQLVMKNGGCWMPGDTAGHLCVGDDGPEAIWTVSRNLGTLGRNPE